ncbi:MAG: phospholipid carrier-dependent glycosyltransferase [Anaerolineae bacterium]|nr:phospholipid carrier-dependent glycosyltransferase [Anaerolineae bacterium]
MTYPFASRFTLHASHFTPFLLFLAALVPRLPGLGRFLTSDENTNIFFAGSDVIAAFLRGDFQGTYWHFYPGVTMSWLDAVGMAGQYFLGWLSGAALPPFTEYIYGDILSLLVANRLPYAVLTAAAVPAVYLLTRQLLPESIALLGALFLAFDPFFLAHSRVAHGDAPVAVFMVLSALTFFIYAARLRASLGQGQNSISSFIPPPSAFLLASAVFGGLAALTKAPGQFMAIFVVGMSLVYAGLEWWREMRSRGAGEQRGRGAEEILRITHHLSRTTHHALQPMTRWLTVILIWGLISLLTFILLWPAMWVDPLGTVQRMLSETLGKVEEGHLVYFLGRPTLDPGPWFYPYVIPFRLTPITLIGAALSLALLVPQINALSLFAHASNLTQNAPRTTHHLLWLFVLSLLLFGALSPKKQDRYLLPLFPLLDLLAAAGWLGLFKLVQHFLWRKTSFLSLPLLPTAYSLLLLFPHFIPVLTYYPYYLTYFNPLMGGPVRAAQTTLMGWGEGMELAAAYLNRKPEAERLYVASTPSQTLLPYFVGTGENFYTNDIAFRADYVVLYLAQMQRLSPSPEIVAYFQARPPEKIITIHDVPYAKIYPGPKLILPDIPPDATPSNIGLGDKLRLAGYKITNPKSKIQNSSLTLYWHALAPLPVNYTVSVRVRATSGDLLAQQDQWPVNNLLPTTLWRQGDYVTDEHTLDISLADHTRPDHFEVVVYQAETGETLGPPITLPLAP